MDVAVPDERLLVVSRPGDGATVEIDRARVEGVDLDRVEQFRVSIQIAVEAIRRRKERVGRHDDACRARLRVRSRTC